MENLLAETLSILHDYGLSKSDVRYVSIGLFEIPLDIFWETANRDYDDGYGGEEVNLQLKVVGDTWWLERHEYDGSEWWEFKQLPPRPELQLSDPAKHVFVDGWRSWSFHYYSETAEEEFEQHQSAYKL